MACITTPVCDPCNPSYTDLGCKDYPPTGCVIYNGDDIPCLEIVKNENLNDVLQHLKDIICALAPTGYSDFDFGCFASEGITTEQEFVEFISGVLCEIIGTQNVGSLTSLSDLYSLIQSLTTNLNLIKNQSLILCFQTISGLTATETITNLLTAVQTIICDHEDRLVALETGSVNTPLTVVDGDTIDFTASGTNNHTLTAEVILDPDGDNSITTSAAGLMCISPDITVVDTSSINFSASGTKDHTITGSVKISATAGNAASILGDGIYVADASTTETAITAIDSTSIDFTTSGTNDHTITADVILDPSITNLLQITPSGLLLSSSLIQDPIVAIDSDSIDLTISGANSHSVRADVIISGAVNNGLLLLSDGLFVDTSSLVDNWALTGNITTAGNFLGTLTNQPLNLRVNNIPSGKITSGGVSSFGYNAAYSNANAIISAFGVNSLYSNTSGSENVAFGSSALYSNTTGNQMVAVGNGALQSAGTASAGTAIGHRALQYSTGDGNTAIGNGAGKTGISTFTGSNCTFVGNSATTTLLTATKAMAIGYNSVVTANSNMALGGTGVDAVSVVIGGTAAVASAVVDINSTTQGFLPPRMTGVQAEAIATPAEGLMVYSLDGTGAVILSKGWWGYTGATWVKLN